MAVLAAAVVQHKLGKVAEIEIATVAFEQAVPFPAFAGSVVECAAFEAIVLMSSPALSPGDLKSVN